METVSENGNADPTIRGDMAIKKMIAPKQDNVTNQPFRSIPIPIKNPEAISNRINRIPTNIFLKSIYIIFKTINTSKNITKKIR